MRNNELYRCYCLELPWLINQHDISCIPEGIYDVEKYSDAKHVDCFYIKNVPGRSGILIHKGTFANEKQLVIDRQIDTLGCQLTGLGYTDVDGNGTLDITGSAIALNSLNYFLPNKFKLIII